MDTARYAVIELSELAPHLSGLASMVLLDDDLDGSELVAASIRSRAPGFSPGHPFPRRVFFSPGIVEKTLSHRQIDRICQRYRQFAADCHPWHLEACSDPAIRARLKKLRAESAVDVAAFFGRPAASVGLGEMLSFAEGLLTDTEVERPRLGPTDVVSPLYAFAKGRKVTREVA